MVLDHWAETKCGTYGWIYGHVDLYPQKISSCRGIKILKKLNYTVFCLVHATYQNYKVETIQSYYAIVQSIKYKNKYIYIQNIII